MKFTTFVLFATLAVAFVSAHSGYQSNRQHQSGDEQDVSSNQAEHQGDGGENSSGSNRRGGTVSRFGQQDIAAGASGSNRSASDSIIPQGRFDSESSNGSSNQRAGQNTQRSGNQRQSGSNHGQSQDSNGANGRAGRRQQSQ